jgi:hypothetical protein
MARAAYSAARSGAESRFWMDVAQAVNEPGGGLAARLREAWRARHDALDQALAQHRARLSVCAELGHGSYAPALAAGSFSADVVAELFPLPVGRTFVYEGDTAAGRVRVETEVADRVREIGGVPCRTVLTREHLDGVLTEQTIEWFSQDAAGSVWYLGEITQEFADGLPVAMDGSWRAGREGAFAGIQVPAAPAIGDAWRMEFLLGAAEDVARVVAVEQGVKVPAGAFEHCVAVQEWSPLDVRELVLKYYAPNVGMVLEVDQVTGERLELLEIR